MDYIILLLCICVFLIKILIVFYVNFITSCWGWLKQ